MLFLQFYSPTIMITDKIIVSGHGDSLRCTITPVLSGNQKERFQKQESSAVMEETLRHLQHENLCCISCPLLLLFLQYIQNLIILNFFQAIVKHFYFNALQCISYLIQSIYMVEDCKSDKKHWLFSKITMSLFNNT